jgi:hypothetical protein
VADWNQAEVAAENEIIEKMAEFSRDPYGWLLYSFDWGHGELAEFAGPEPWQKELLCEIRDGLTTVTEAMQFARSSGHGIGKSAMVSWLILWAMSTCDDTRGVVTANTDTQLRTKTWPELSKWHRLFIGKHLFVLTATAIYSSDALHEKTWRIDLVPWSESNTEAFAGLHNRGKRIILVFDEASAIADKIWEVSEGALTDEATEIFWFAFGNPTRNTGRFHSCFHSLAHRWNHKQIDARTVSITNKTQIQKWIDDYGEDSDFVRVRVKGEFPNISERQFVPTSLVSAARGKHLQIQQYDFAPVIIGVDPAWTGSDETVIFKRQGLASSQLMAIPRNDDDTVIAGYIGKFQDELRADAVFIDQGWGTGIYSAGKAMGRNWTLVSFGGASNDQGYLNKRAEMWGLMKSWLKEGGAIPDDPILAEEIPGPEYFVKLNGKIALESKEDMKKRGLLSPNRADALALTFAFPVRARKSGLHAKAEFAKREYQPI